MLAIYHVHYLVMLYKPETSTNCKPVSGGIIRGHNNTFHIVISAYSLPSSQIQSRQGRFALSSITDQRELQLKNEFLLHKMPALFNQHSLHKISNLSVTSWMKKVLGKSKIAWILSSCRHLPWDRLSANNAALISMPTGALAPWKGPADLSTKPSSTEPWLHLQELTQTGTFKILLHKITGQWTDHFKNLIPCSIFALFFCPQLAT